MLRAETGIRHWVDYARRGRHAGLRNAGTTDNPCRSSFAIWYRFFFYSNEGSPRESVYIHVGKDDCEAKFWVEPVVSVAYNDGFSAKALRHLHELVEQNKGRIARAWHDYFG